MSIFSRLRNQTLRWWYDVPLPACEADATPIFHPWYRFDSSVNKWVSFDSTSRLTGTGYKPSDGGKFVLVTWEGLRGSCLKHICTTNNPEGRKK
ncbi:uncharacterized protein ASPGLDRAFT_51520 [Aspergillus glaucus CBS 516.65]|uniref:Uncharacterized protein n=1 Tax=Aspergillus glaucus CBS 516.65 TaxID=1160497 RepID=A0A1L9V8Y7_ASPGL|nr:hypothetical protein ASPGLDRAFT_51520 [Aspergillus glaucus CBS 516.65]OJJ80312.1 hypothetical protein ASPGLDRAFT_51520 [Aspergillus glaucus CBS 516.65]